MTRYPRAEPHRVRLLALSVATVFLTGLTACGGSDDLRDIERGTDHRPAIEESPIEEGN